ncbi:MAG: XdhC family protein [Sandaracinaceae bacterium]
MSRQRQRGAEAFADELRAAREPFVVATVVWTRGRGSAKAGDRAVISASGAVRGWIGGACSFDTVRREGGHALASGRPRVLCIGTPDDFPAPSDERVVERATCASEGSYEIFLEPHLPAAQLVVLGDSPLAATLSELGVTLGYDVAWGRRADPAAGTRARALDGADLSALTVDDRTFIVVATQGSWDLDALRAALVTDAPYVALVASARRWSRLRARLTRELGEGAVERVRAPAGLDLGPVPHEEIAVAILAEIIREKAARTRAG